MEPPWIQAPRSPDRAKESLIEAEVEGSLAHRSERTRLLMANEPRAYREVIAEAVRGSRPRVEVKTVEPGELESSVSAFEPDMVICNDATPPVRKAVPVWLELYPDFASDSVVSVDGRVSTLENIQFSDILSIIDQTERLLRRKN